MSTTSEGLMAVLRSGAEGPAVRVEHTFRTSARDLWEAVSDPARISRWMAATTVDGDAVVGARYRVDFGDDGETTGTVTRCEPPRLLEVTWLMPGEPDTVVRAEVTPAGQDSAHLVLDHSRLPADQVHGYAAGWQAHLATLAAQLDGIEPPPWDDTFGRLLPAYRAAYPDVAG